MGGWLRASSPFSLKLGVNVNGNTRRLCGCAAFVCLCLLGLVLPCGVRAQTDITPTANMTQAKPEGIAPVYAISGHIIYPPMANEATAYPNEIYVNQNIDYHWKLPTGDDAVLNVIGGNGPLYFNTTDNGWSWDVTLSGAAYQAFGNNATVWVPSRPHGDSGLNTKLPPPYALGVTLVQIVDASGKPVSGAVVTFFNGSSQSWLSTETTSTGRAVFGQGINAAADQPYPPGLTSQVYLLSCSANGFQTVRTPAAAGGTYIGNTVKFVMVAAGQTVIPPTVAPTTSTDNPDQVTTTSGGAFDPTSLFTLDPADLAALKAAASQLANYGPFGVPAQITAAYNNAFANVNTGTGNDGTQPGYWIIYLNSVDLDNATASLPAHPANYNGQAAYQAPAAPGTIFDHMMPSQIDMLPYAGYILRGRRIALVAFWCAVAIALLVRFTPQLRV